MSHQYSLHAGPKVVELYHPETRAIVKSQNYLVLHEKKNIFGKTKLREVFNFATRHIEVLKPGSMTVAKREGFDNPDRKEDVARAYKWLKETYKSEWLSRE